MLTNESSYVLIADDDPLMLKTVGIILRNAGFRVVAVSDGQAALEQMKKEKPALALLDVMMGNISGLDLVRMIRADADLEDLTVFLLTARAMPHEKQQGYSAGANDYITKPFSNRDLVSRVHAVLDRNISSPGAAVAPADGGQSDSSLDPTD
jgi:DNA-binding response OmpR family regulator